MDQSNLATIAVDQLGIQWPSDKVRADIISTIAKRMEKDCSTPILPAPGESLAVSNMTPKTAALAFDRVYSNPIIVDPVPKDIGFYPATENEILTSAYALLFMAAVEAGIDIERSEVSPREAATNERETLRVLFSGVDDILGSYPTMIYHNTSSFASDFPSGSREVLMSAIADISIVNENELKWDQIREFRADAEATRKYRRITRWIDGELKKSTPEQVIDIVGDRIDDYEWAVKKHGIKASLGILTAFLDPKFLATTSAVFAAGSVVGDAFWGALSAASIAVGRATVSFGTQMVDSVDTRRKENYEIAYIHDLRKNLT